MDNNINLLSSVQVQRKPTKKTNHKAKKSNTKPPVKVVYISNPMKIKTSASEFRALVQELTGQDAEFPDPTKFPAIDGGDGDGDGDGDQAGVDSTAKVDGDQPSESNNSSTTTTTSVYDAFDDDVFMPQMMESFVGMTSSAVTGTTNMWYDSPNYHQVHDVIRSLDGM